MSKDRVLRVVGETSQLIEQRNYNASASPTYVFNDATSDVDPGSGAIRILDADYTLATGFNISKTDTNGGDKSTGLGKLKNGDIISFTQDNDATKSVSFTIDSTPIDNGAYYHIPVAHDSSGIGGAFTQGKRLGVGVYVDAQSGGGWLGSETRIKLSPWDVVSYNDKDGVSIQDDGGVVNDAAGKISEMITGVYIPTGYKATAFMISL